MPDLSPAGSTESPGLSHRIGREIIVQHERVATFPLQRIDDLGIAGGTQCDSANGLGLAPGEQGRAVGPGQDAHLAGDRPHLVKGPTAGPPSSV